MNITIKDVPKPLHKRLQQASEQSGRSLNKFIIFTLERCLLPAKDDRQVLLNRIKKRRSAMEMTISEDSLRKAIQQDRE